MVNTFVEDTSNPNIKEESINSWYENITSEEGKILGDLNIIFCSDEYLLKINKEYLNHNYYTDIITFDYTNANIISGDLFISTDRVRENAKQFGVSFDNELARVMVHGLLHLLGYHDSSESEKSEMRKLEEHYLKRL